MAKGSVAASVDCTVGLDDSGGTLRQLESYSTKVDFDLTGHGLVDVTTMGDAGHTYASDELENCSFNIELWLDDTATTGSWVVIESLRDHTSAESFIIDPFGSTSGYPRLSGDCWLESGPVLDISVPGIVKMTASFKVNGAVTVTTVP